MISLIVPMFNEEKNAKKIIELIATSIDMKMEIIVVNDGSIDKTKLIVTDLLKKYSFLKLINHKKNMGYSKAIGTGLKNTKYNIVSFIDADLQNHPSDINNMIKYIDKYGIVVGKRMNRKDTILRLLISRIYNIFIDFLFGITIKDVNGKPKVFRNLNFNIETKEWAIDVEIIHKTKKYGFKVLQIPVKHSSRTSGKSTTNITKGIETMIELLKYRIRSL